MPTRHTLNTFIKTCQEVHNNFYDYVEVKEYVKLKQHVTVICPTHGKFIVRCDKHLDGQGCRKCYEDSKRDFTTESFILELQKIFGDKYNYDLVDYRSKKKFVTLVCPRHGKFSVKARTLLNFGVGCLKCFQENRCKTTETFVKEVENIHGDKYDYSLIKYEKSYSIVQLKCKKHDKVFSISPNNLLQRKGCPACGIESSKNSKVLSTEEFILRAKNIHENKYDYSKTVYKNCLSHVSIYCKTCQKYFKQKASYHLAGHGCQRCASSSQSSAVEKNLLDFLKEWDTTIKHRYKPDWLLGKELDIFLPKHNLAIEYNGSYWHSNLFKDEEYHLKKYDICFENNIKLIHIFEFEDITQWKQVLKNYLEDSSKFNITFENKKRVVKNYVIHGESKIIPNT